ncbi:uncharacterized protein BKCO1_6000229 [Diplodia corticola]|uniref:Uncharacterized protein n=1 Tax=Diplodia corticola TaxID=236234 RepID=A0A1J9RAV8_9PEZI|nr:uncharacterized protein BKCO1_6000229 [Diplodia corticola]OJD37609.1 hypothetical protein BKCO1_6000229 [Diplodia corticola]
MKLLSTITAALVAMASTQPAMAAPLPSESSQSLPGVVIGLAIVDKGPIDTAYGMINICLKSIKKPDGPKNGVCGDRTLDLADALKEFSLSERELIADTFRLRTLAMYNQKKHVPRDDHGAALDKRHESNTAASQFGPELFETMVNVLWDLIQEIRGKR